jgi:hypothetical protein
VLAGGQVGQVAILVLANGRVKLSPSSLRGASPFQRRIHTGGSVDLAVLPLLLI